MAKLAVLFFVAIAFQAAFAANWQKEQSKIQKIDRKIQEITNEASNAVQNIQADQHRRPLALVCNELAHNIENIVYTLQRAAQNVQGEDKKDVKQIATKLSEIVYSLQQAINAEPNQLKAQLKTQLQKIAEEAQKLAQCVQQIQQPQEWELELSNGIKQALWDILATVQKVQTQVKNHDKNHQEINNKLQDKTSEVIDAVQKIKSADEQTAQDLADCARQLAQRLNKMVVKIQREADNQEGQTKTILKQVATKLSEIRADLERCSNTQKNDQEKVTEIKNQLKANIRDVANEAQKLIQAAQQSRDQDDQGAKLLAKIVLLDCKAACKSLKTQLDIIAQN